MYNYQFGHEDEMSSGFTEVCHEKKYTQEEFEDIVVEASMIILVDRRPEWTEGMFPEEGKVSHGLKKKLYRCID